MDTVSEKATDDVPQKIQLSDFGGYQCFINMNRSCYSACKAYDVKNDDCRLLRALENIESNVWDVCGAVVESA